MTTQLPLVFDAPRRGKPPRHLADLTADERVELLTERGLPGFRAKQLSTHYFERLVESPEEMAEGVRRLREKRPDLRWDRLPDPLRKQDLPRLITVQTILDYLERKRAA